MAIADPLPASAFFDDFDVEECEFVQQFNQQRSVTGGGDTKYADRGTSQWKAECTSSAMLHSEAEGFMALLNSRGGGLKTVLMYNKRLPYPVGDPDGTIIGATEPEIDVITDRQNISFSGFPNGYELARGTYFGCVFDTSRYYLGQLVEAATADGSGDVATVAIWPPLPASIVTETVISVSKPCAKFRITPGSAYPSLSSVLHAKVKFSAEQTYGQ